MTRIHPYSFTFANKEEHKIDHIQIQWKGNRQLKKNGFDGTKSAISSAHFIWRNINMTDKKNTQKPSFNFDIEQGTLFYNY